MLSDEVYEKLNKRLTERIDNVNQYILKQIGEKLEELQSLKPTQTNQLVNMMKYGGDYKKIVKELSKITNLNVQDIEEIFEEIAREDYRFAEKFYKYRNKQYIPFDENTALSSKLDEIKKQAIKDYMNIANTRAIGYVIKNKKGKLVHRTIKQVYNQVIDEAVLSITTGQETFAQTLKNTLEEIGESGLRVLYPSGYSKRLDSVVRMNINDSLNQLHNQTQEIMGKQFGADGVEITAHINPAKDHEWLQGRQFSLKEYEKLENGKEAIAEDGTIIHANPKRRKISTYNCNHKVMYIVLGISKPNYTKEELFKILSDNEDGFNLNNRHYTNYEGTQLQRKLELKIRQERDKMELLEKDNTSESINEVQRCKSNIRRYQKERRELQKLIYGG